MFHVFFTNLLHQNVWEMGASLEAVMTKTLPYGAVNASPVGEILECMHDSMDSLTSPLKSGDKSFPDNL